MDWNKGKYTIVIHDTHVIVIWTGINGDVLFSIVNKVFINKHLLFSVSQRTASSRRAFAACSCARLRRLAIVVGERANTFLAMCSNTSTTRSCLDEADISRVI